ncbi:MAG: hypothetical protein ACP5MD_11720 [Verrucomicrobiia bacterium]
MAGRIGNVLRNFSQEIEWIEELRQRALLRMKLCMEVGRAVPGAPKHLSPCSRFRLAVSSEPDKVPGSLFASIKSHTVVSVLSTAAETDMERLTKLAA